LLIGQSRNEIIHEGRRTNGLGDTEAVVHRQIVKFSPALMLLESVPPRDYNPPAPNGKATAVGEKKRADSLSFPR
jgi:hypothetical protein